VIASHLSTRLFAAVAASVAGAIAGAAALLLAYGFNPPVRFEMDRDLPRTVKGLFPIERGGGKTFAWTRRTAEVTLPDLNRRTPWLCRVGVLGGRPAGVPQPTIRFSVDGIDRQAWTGAGADSEILVDVPARADGVDGLVLGLAVSETFRPADDPRDLGVPIDRIACEPATGRFAMAPFPALQRAAAAGAIIGAGLGALGLSAPIATGGALVAVVLQAWTLAFGMAPYAGGRPPVVPLAAGLMLGVVVLSMTLELFRRQALSTATRAALGFSAVACFLKLTVLLHPDMPAMDAVFQAHRLEWVLSGRYFFTSLTPDGYQFPYGISLYVVAAPFAAIMRDHVSLLRIVVCVAEMLAGLCLFGIVARTWADRGTALVSLVLFHTTLVAAAVAGTGNLTNAFGESMALMAVATLVAVPLTWPIWTWLIIPIAVALVAFLAHFSTFMVLAVAMCAIGLAYYLFGGPSLERAATCVLLGLGLSTLLAVLVFYGHFWSTYRGQVTRLSGEVQSVVARPPTPSPAASGTTSAPMAAPPSTAQTDAQPTAPPPGRPTAARRARPGFSEKVATLGRRNASAFGWLLPAMAAIGLVVLVRRRIRDRLTLAIGGWLVTLAGCAALAVFTPLELRYQLTVVPALAVLGGVAVTAAWRAGSWRRWVLAAAWLAAAAMGVHAWFIWIL